MRARQIVGVFVVALSALFVSACASAWPVPDGSCDYEQIAEDAIKARYPGFVAERDLAMTQYEDVVIAFYPLSRSMPGGTAHAIVGVKDCSVREVYLTQ